jgi:citrate lyase gamma subunit
MNITLTKEQEESILTSCQEAITTAIKFAVEKELTSIKNDWQIQNQVQQLLRKQFGTTLNEVVTEKLKDRKVVEELVSEKLAASIQSRLTKQLNALSKTETQV